MDIGQGTWSSVPGTAPGNGGVVQSKQPDLDIILSYRLLSDGRVEDVEVVDTNLEERAAGLFVAALEDSSPTPRWTPRLRAELSEDYQDLLLAFGRDRC